MNISIPEQLSYRNFIRLAKYLALLLPVFLFSCRTGNLQRTESIIRKFEQERAFDKREVVFDIHAENRNGNVLLTGETSDPELKNDLLKQLSLQQVDDQVSVLPDSTIDGKNWGLINLSVASLRARPGHSEELVTQSTMGTPVRILKRSDNWFLIQTPDHYISWVESNEVVPMTHEEMDHWRNSTRLIYKGDFDLLYHEAAMNEPVSDIITGNIVTLTDKSSEWLKVQIPDGRQAYTKPDEWEEFNSFFSNQSIDTHELVQTAGHFTGRPYLWGGTSAKAMDCSGFTKTVYFMQGVILARDASQQIKYGKVVDPGSDFRNLEPGDLLFFGTPATEGKPEHATHVAISLGGTEFIHASGMVKHNSFDPKNPLFSRYRSETFLAVRRIAGMENSPGIVPVSVHPWY